MNADEKRVHFDTCGFIIWHQAFSPDEMVEITREFDGQAQSAAVIRGH